MVDKLPVGTATIANVRAGVDRVVAQRAWSAGIWIWPSFTLLDAYMCFVAYPGAPFSLFLCYRIIIEFVLLVGYRLSDRESVAPEQLFLFLKLTYVAVAVTIALMAFHLGGIRSPYMHGISIVALVWAALIPSPWQKALPTFAGIALSFPFVMGMGAAISPAARSIWISQDTLIGFASNYVFVVATSILSVILGHMVWSAQQEARSLGSYELEGLIGMGGMGEVWRAKHRLLARKAAIKLIRPEVLGLDEAGRNVALTRFEREAQATALLRSPHTIDVYDFGVTNTGAFYYVMELLEGFDAEVLLNRFGPLPPARAVHLLLQICDSLGEAHSAGLVHRDIKPSNVFICRYGRAVDFVKMLDFGLVKPTGTVNTDLTGDQGMAGTPAFMSPEQALGSAALDERTDLYAVGCMAYWFLTARTVFDGDSSLSLMVQHAESNPVRPSQRAAQPIPPALECVVMTCLEKDPAKRPQRADDLANALARSLDGVTWTHQEAREWWDQHSK